MQAENARTPAPLTIEEKARRINWLLANPNHPNHAPLVALLQLARGRRAQGVRP